MSIEINLKGQVALVTGATGQLGRCIVRRLAEAGADIAINYLGHEHENYYQNDRTVPQQLAYALEKELAKMGRRSCVIAADVTKRDDVFRMRDAITQELGDVSIIVSTAMKMIRVSLAEATVSDFNQQFATSVDQHLHLMHAFVPAMQQAQYGRIVGINSVASLASNREYTPYSTAKMAMDGVFRQMSRELAADNINVNQVAPSWINSEVFRETIDQQHEMYARQTPSGRAGSDHEIANVICFLCSDLASFINGALIPVSGAQEFVSI